MSSPVFSLRENDSLHSARELMDLQRIRHIPIVTVDNVFTGLITHRDILSATISKLADLDPETQKEIDSGIPIHEIMRADITSVEPETPSGRRPASAEQQIRVSARGRGRWTGRHRHRGRFPAPDHQPDGRSGTGTLTPALPEPEAASPRCGFFHAFMPPPARLCGPCTDFSPSPLVSRHGVL